PIRGHGRKVSGLVERGVAVPLAARIVDKIGRARVREIPAAAEREMLEEMGETGLAADLGRRTALVKHLDADQREAVVLEQDHGQAVGQVADRRAAEVERCGCRRGNCQRRRGEENARPPHYASAMMSRWPALVWCDGGRPRLASSDR